MSLDPTLVQIGRSVLRLALDIFTGASSKETALHTLDSAATILRDDLRAEAVARGEVAGDLAESVRFPRE